MPAQSQILEASEKTPLLVMFLRFDMPTVREVLSRDDGYTLWHSGITDGPHGLSLVVEVLDESGGRRMADHGTQDVRLYA